MEIISSNRGGQKLLFAGYIYTKQHQRLSGTRWICVERMEGCVGAIRTNGVVGVPVILNEHNHLPSEEKTAVAKARSTMKRVAENGVGQPHEIFNRVQRTLSNDERMVLPDAETCKRSIRRSLTSNEPMQPYNLQNLVVAPAEWTLTRGPNPQRFLLYDNGVNAQRRIVMYGTDDCLNTLCESNDVFMERSQIVLHGSLGETTVPLVYAYLERKDTAVYTELLTALTNQCTARNLTFAPQFIHIDFEDAVIKSIRAVIGLVPEIQCCFFHLCQNTWKHIQNLGLVDTYKNDPAFSLFCCMLDGIAFLPVADIVPGMAYLRTIMPPAAQPLVDYFDETYVNGRIVNQRRLPPQFPPELWSVHDETLNNYPRTNNYAEGWNLKYKLTVGQANPTFWKSVGTIQLHNEEVATKIVQTGIGAPPKKKKQRKYARQQVRLRTLCVNYNNQPVTPQTRGHNIKLERM